MPKILKTIKWCHKLRQQRTTSTITKKKHRHTTREFWKNDRMVIFVKKYTERRKTCNGIVPLPFGSTISVKQLRRLTFKFGHCYGDNDDNKYGNKQNNMRKIGITTTTCHLNRTNKQNNLHVNWNLNIRNSLIDCRKLCIYIVQLSTSISARRSREKVGERELEK